MTKLLTIIVPAYDMEAYLPKCLRSVAEVNSAELDVIVVNDGSTDRTSEIAHGFAAEYPDVFRVIDKPNGNYGSCINAALSIANGRFVKILDADDTYDTAAFAEYLARLAKVPDETDMVVNDYVIVDESENAMESSSFCLPTDVAFPVDELARTNCSMVMYSVAYRVELLRSIAYRQTEGISYTDTEWCYLPPAFARFIRYFSLPVYRYLRGRAGQSAEWSVMVKNVSMMEAIFKRMLRQYDRLASADRGRSYLELQLRRLISIVNALRLDAMRHSDVAGFLDSLRDLIARYPFLSESLGDRIMFARTPFRFRYLEFMMKHTCLAAMVLDFVHWYVRARSKLSVAT